MASLVYGVDKRATNGDFDAGRMMGWMCRVTKKDQIRNEQEDQRWHKRAQRKG